MQFTSEEIKAVLISIPFLFQPREAKALGSMGFHSPQKLSLIYLGCIILLSKIDLFISLITSSFFIEEKPECK